jgi:hypothetical protein
MRLSGAKGAQKNDLGVRRGGRDGALPAVRGDIRPQHSNECLARNLFFQTELSEL